MFDCFKKEEDLIYTKENGKYFAYHAPKGFVYDKCIKPRDAHIKQLKDENEKLKLVADDARIYQMLTARDADREIEKLNAQIKCNRSLADLANKFNAENAYLKETLDRSQSDLKLLSFKYNLLKAQLQNHDKVSQVEDGKAKLEICECDAQVFLANNPYVCISCGKSCHPANYKQQKDEHCEVSGAKLDKPERKPHKCPACGDQPYHGDCNFCNGTGILWESK
jgi:predicted RNase H-like nuclease (RuvC/YqgF family)